MHVSTMDCKTDASRQKEESRNCVKVNQQGNRYGALEYFARETEGACFGDGVAMSAKEAGLPIREKECHLSCCHHAASQCSQEPEAIHKQ